jgi:hypothetical protein
MCAKQTGAAFSVGAVARAYSASGASQNIGATILTGPGNSSCVSNITQRRPPPRDGMAAAAAGL